MKKKISNFQEVRLKKGDIEDLWCDISFKLNIIGHTKGRNKKQNKKERVAYEENFFFSFKILFKNKNKKTEND